MPPTQHEFLALNKNLSSFSKQIRYKKLQCNYMSILFSFMIYNRTVSCVLCKTFCLTSRTPTFSDSSFLKILIKLARELADFRKY